MADLNSLRSGSGPSPAGHPPRPRADTLGKVEAVDAGALRSAGAPSTADIFEAILDLGRKIERLSKNQQVLDAKLDHLAKHVAAIDYNLIHGISYLNGCFWYLEALVISGGDPSHIRGFQPGSMPHWR